MLYILILGLIPLIFFAVANHFQGLQSGVWFGMIGSVALAFVMWAAFDYFDYEVVLIIISMIVLGAVSLRTNREIYIKLQPVFSNLVSVLFLLWYEVFDKSFFLQMLPKLGGVFNEEQKSMLLDPSFQITITSLSRYMILWLIIHAVLMTFCAFRRSNKIWLGSKAMGIPFICAGVFLTYRLLN